MRFGENSRKGASSLIVVMLVAVIALAGTAVYVALDRTVLTTDGYVLPGSTIEYNDGDTGGPISYTILGYSNGTYIWDTPNGYIDMEIMPTNTKTGTETVDVPGIGKTKATVYSATLGGANAVLRTVFNGLPYDIKVDFNGTEIQFVSMNDANIQLGSYDTFDKFSRTYTSGTASITLERISASTNDDFVYAFEAASGPIAYYVGDANGIPADFTTGSSYHIDGKVADIRLNISNNTIPSFTMEGMTYTASNTS